MIDRKLVRAKLESCRDYLQKLGPLAREPRARFLSDYVVHNAAERLVQFTVDAAVDINNHLIIEGGQPVPADYYTSFTALVGIRALPPPLARSLARTTGLRNRLVHAYQEVDPVIVYRGLKLFIRDYTRYIGAIRAYIGV